MMFSNAILSAILATSALALPQVYPRGTPTSSAATSSSASPSSSASASAGGGGVQIVNNLDSTVYVWSTSDGGSDQQTVSAGGTYSEKWQKQTGDGGISIKMSTSEDKSSVLQFEYKVDGEKLYWDLSSIDLDKNSEFIKSGFSATPDDSSCKSASCSAGDANCAESYQHPDDVNTNSCTTGAGISVTLG
ncbi:hypothetical protein BDV23DRAFT_184488 [Aspergillus alliaceus]|uniref:GPI anchored cell wall protein n=1 Tax=Petromyces alliaceus TaxID=209559 RepID=A0A5N7C5R8_PETAA|nr:hypothetical protein BDV23DRAFT_184488 [Aspergillus alliaceus]